MKNPTREEELSFYYLYLKNYLASYRFEGVTETMIRARAEKEIGRASCRERVF